MFLADGRGLPTAGPRRLLRLMVTLALIAATTAAVLVLPAQQAHATVGSRNSVLWNSNGAKWNRVEELANKYDVVAVTESGAPPALPVARQWAFPVGANSTYRVYETQWNGHWLYSMATSDNASRNGLAIVTNERATDVFFHAPVPWQNSTTTGPNSRPAFGVGFADLSAFWVFHAGSGRSDSLGQ